MAPRWSCGSARQLSARGGLPFQGFPGPQVRTASASPPTMRQCGGAAEFQPLTSTNPATIQLLYN
eukprot:2784857-Amphidinium_carterae.1